MFYSIDYGIIRQGKDRERVNIMDTYKKLSRKASKLVDRLQDNITTGKIPIYENYGQKEIRHFEDRELSEHGLTYQEKCNIKDILYKVSSIS